MKKKLFGTDGIRGKFDNYPLTEEIITKVAYFTGKKFGKRNGKVLIGYDTRESCEKIKNYLFNGFSLANIISYDCGVFPTPAVASMVKEKGFDFGVVISASHNPYWDNGIKFFKENGEKLNDDVEEEIEEEVLKSKEIPSFISNVRLHQINLDDDYINFLLKNFRDINLGEKRILLDTANGSAFRIAPKLFEKVEVDVITINNSPNGRNINHNCGSLFAESFWQKIRDYKCDIGFTFDGDCDRCLLVLKSGEVLDGDYLLYNEAKRRKQNNSLKNNLVVGTIMSNLGLETALKKEGIRFLRANVGDKYVLDLLKKEDGEIGGEPSGHIVMLDKSTTGDGLLTALTYLTLIEEKGSELKLKQNLTMLHQKIVNIKVKVKKNLEEIAEYHEIIEEGKKLLSDDGRIVLRYSGTEPLLRVMVEAKSKELMEEVLTRIVGSLKSIL